MEEEKKMTISELLASGKSKVLDVLKSRPIKPVLPKIEPPPSSWKEYKDWVEAQAKQRKYYWYRGQADATWGLNTTFHREAKNTGMAMARYLDLIERGDVHYQVCSRLNEHFNMGDRLQYASYLALLRNHGFPTPMLDWTLSPYIAAFFAFRECNGTKPECRHVKIYIFDCDLWSATLPQSYNLDDQNQHVSVVRPYAKYNPRQLIQNTVYTATNVDDIEGHIQVNGRAKGQTYLYCFTFLADIRKEVMRELDLMGINEMTMFPDLDGLCREMKQRHF